MHDGKLIWHFELHILLLAQPVHTELIILV